MIVLTFQWPSDDPDARTYSLVTDVSKWDVDDRLTSSVLQSRLTALLATSGWTTRHCHPVSGWLAVAIVP
ncbi:hypothetical protein QRX50_15295 [Amycolatopsis carbonis]|uniref:Uncharacterized protein n=1 Tax=Amycolatopsis carbonis TaxID=715471 RepID=A0A9Y2IKY6_9PSEU|nr:hypothetical protein [Amycolatopsis sp. 2-15]WIX82027.1 hypothetical protein QRX50_15295 [Amycolatopsis sp. 2-15]